MVARRTCNAKVTRSIRVRGIYFSARPISVSHAAFNAKSFLMKLAVVGGGPSALYVTSRLFSLLKHDSNIRVHVYDRLWSPYGLVRYGVAPDHPEVKVRFLSLCIYAWFSLVSANA